MSGPLAIACVARALLLCALLVSVVPSVVRAHAEGDGVDAGFAHVFAQVDAAGAATVEVRITETDDCGRFSALGLSGSRDPLTVNGTLQQTAACVFGGEIVLAERGRWTVTVAVAYNGHPAAISVPVGFSGEPGSFERTDWLHVEASIESSVAESTWYWPLGTLAYAVIGLLIGTVIEVFRRKLVARQAV